MSRIVRMDTLDVATQRTSVAPLLREGSMLTTVSAMTDASSSPQRPSTPDRKQHWTVDSTIVEMAPNRGVRSREDDDDYEMITPVSKTPSQTPAAPPAPRPQSSGAKLRSREDDEDYEVVVPMARPSSSHNPQLHPPDSSGSQAVSFPPRGAASSPPPMHPAEQEFQSASRQLHRMVSQKVARKGPRAGARPEVPIAFQVYLMDESATQLRYERGKHTRVSKILRDTFRHYDLEKQSYPLFTLWMMDGTLELPLKYDFEPYFVRQQWALLSERYMRRAPYKAPRLALKRAPFISRAHERKVRDPVALRLLFLEAEANVHCGRYPVDREGVLYLAAIRLQLLFIEDGKPEKSPFVITEDEISLLVPAKMIRKEHNFQWSSTILEMHSKKYVGKRNELMLHLLYLQYLWQYSWYGCTWFFGEYLQSMRGITMQDKPNVKVRIAVTTQDITLIDQKNDKVTHRFRFDDIAWDSHQEGDYTPVFYIEHGPIDRPKVLQIMSSQARLIDNFVTQSVDQLEIQDMLLANLRMAQGGPMELPLDKIDTRTPEQKAHDEAAAARAAAPRRQSIFGRRISDHSSKRDVVPPPGNPPHAIL